MVWELVVFGDCYAYIKHRGYVLAADVAATKDDLKQLLTTPPRLEQSRAKVNKVNQQVDIHGIKVTLNQPFIDVISKMLGELDMDEVETAALLIVAQDQAQARGVSLLEAGFMVFYERYQYILEIVTYLISRKQLDLLDVQASQVWTNVFASFTKIYALISLLNAAIDKQKVTLDINDLEFILSVRYLRQRLWQCHEKLATLLFVLIDTYPELATEANTKQLIEFIKKNITNDDSALIHFVPVVLAMVTRCFDHDANVEAIHKYVADTLQADHKRTADADNNLDLAKSQLAGLELVAYTVFLTKFIGWCKVQGLRTQKYNFRNDILQYIEWLISYGVMEALLSFGAETAVTTEIGATPYTAYDFRALLQRQYPRLRPAKFEYPASAELLSVAKQHPAELPNIHLLVTIDYLKVSPEFSDDLVVGFFHDFFVLFVGNAAIVLTSLRDNEEDFLLASKQEAEDETVAQIAAAHAANDEAAAALITKVTTYDLDTIATKLELERFYLAFTYVYNGRPKLAQRLWEDDVHTDLAGFVLWGLNNNTLLLISATFCMLIGLFALAGAQAAVRLWDILAANAGNKSKKGDYSHILIDLIVELLEYYATALYDSFEHDVHEQLRLKQKRQEAMFLRPSGGDGDNITPVVIEYAEDAVVFISGFVLLILLIVEHLASDDHPRMKDIRQAAFDRFLPVVIEFLHLDNVTLTLAALASSSRQGAGLLLLLLRSLVLPHLVVLPENKVVIGNLMVGLLRTFAQGASDLELVHKAWDIMDRWIYHSLAPRLKAAEPENNGIKKPGLPTRNIMLIPQGFAATIGLFSQAVTFVEAITVLLAQKLTYTHRLQLRYPADLGAGYRPHNYVGIWPYFEFIITELLVKLADMDPEDALILRRRIVKLLDLALSLVDWPFLTEIVPQTATKQFKLDDIVYLLDWPTFVKSHHGVAAIATMFNGDAFSALAQVVTGGKVERAVAVLRQLLHLQSLFLHHLAPVLTLTPKHATLNIYFPPGVGTTSTLFDEMLLFNLPTVVTIALDVGSADPTVAEAAIDTLAHIAQSSQFLQQGLLAVSYPPLLHSNRLLTTFVSVDESDRIIAQFIAQFCDVTGTVGGADDDKLRFKILKFLLENLRRVKGPTVAHFLLGYSFGGGHPQAPVASAGAPNTLLKCLVEYLRFNVLLLAEVDLARHNARVVDHLPAQYALMCLEIIVHLAQSPQFGRQTLAYIRAIDSELLKVLVADQLRVDSTTLWSGIVFDGNMDIDHINRFVDNDPTAAAFDQFIAFRTWVVKFFALEYAAAPLAVIRECYLELALNYHTQFLNGLPKVLGFLDILNFGFVNFDAFAIENLASSYHLGSILTQIGYDEMGTIDMQVVRDFIEVENLAKVPATTTLPATGNTTYKSLLPPALSSSTTSSHSFIDRYSRPFSSTSMVDKFVDASLSMALRLSTALVPSAPPANDTVAPLPPTEQQLLLVPLLRRAYIMRTTRTAQLECLRGWCRLIDALIEGNTTDAATGHARADAGELILEVFQAILPKINDYLDSDVVFSEELISLAVLLFDKYDQYVVSLTEGESQLLAVSRLMPLFKSGVVGLLNLNSTPTLRLDLYVLLTKFLHRVFGVAELAKETRKVVAAVDKRMVAIVANDAIYLEGPLRITLILLLEALVHLSPEEIVSALEHNNLLNLLVMLIKRTDDMIEMCRQGKGGVLIQTLVVELVAFKATIYLLVRVAQHKHGALCLIQLELYLVLMQLHWLKIDPDLGVGLVIEKQPDHEDVRLQLVLDTPVGLSDLVGRGKNPKAAVVPQLLLFLEFLVPLFQLIATVNVLSGPNYKPSFNLTRDLLKQCRPLVVGVMKRQLILEEDGKLVPELDELAKIFTLLDSLTHPQK